MRFSNGLILILLASLSLPAWCSDIFDAIQTRNTHLLLTILQTRRSDCGKRRYFGETPLHRAIACDNIQYVRMLLRAGADVNASEDTQGLTPLDVAVQHASPQIVKLLLEAGALPTRTDKRHAPPVFAAVQRGDIPILNLLLRHGVTLGSDPTVYYHIPTLAMADKIVDLRRGPTTDDDFAGECLITRGFPGSALRMFRAGAVLGERSLGAAVRTRDFDLLRSLLTLKPSITSISKALLACPSSKMLRLLLKAGGNPNVTGDFGETPLHEARTGDIVDCLVEAGAEIDAIGGVADETPLESALRAGYRTVVESLLRHGANPNLSDRFGEAPLHELARWGKDPTLVGVLVAHGADVNAQTSDGETPLLKAASVPMQAALVDAGADIGIKSKRGLTFLHHAMTVSLVEQCLAAGQDPNAIDYQGRRPLYFAQTAEVAERLIAAGADINALDLEGQTALFNAAATGHGRVVERLLKLGADASIKDKRGLTPGMAAEIFDYPEIARQFGPLTMTSDAPAAAIVLTDDSLAIAQAVLEFRIPAPVRHETAYLSIEDQDPPGPFLQKLKARGWGFRPRSAAVTEPNLWQPTGRHWVIDRNDGATGPMVRIDHIHIKNADEAECECGIQSAPVAGGGLHVSLCHIGGRWIVKGTARTWVSDASVGG